MSKEPSRKRATSQASEVDEPPRSPSGEIEPGSPALASDAAAAAETKADGAPSSGRFLASFRLSERASLLFGLALPALLLATNMWRVRSFTIDDAYISYRYAANLARGLGLVYNAGERIEGYTNFLWTVLLAVGIRLGLDPDIFAKVLGALSAFGALGFTYVLAARLKPFDLMPCVATWLLASSIVTSGYAVFGLETSFFVFLLLAGTWLFFRESDAAAAALKRDGDGDDSDKNKSKKSPPEDRRAWLRAFPFSGLVFALAGLTRPEAPMFIGILMLFLGRRMVSRQNLLRGVLFATPIAAHLLWRHSYYGAWLPNTLTAKTGNLEAQIGAGADYMQRYLTHGGAIIYLGIFGVALGYVAKRIDILAIAVTAAAVYAYVVIVGGDWMPFFRFASTFEPFAFLLVDLAARDMVDRRSRPVSLALVAFAIAMTAHRGGSLQSAQRTIITKEERFWKMAAGGTAKWLLENGKPGTLALGDIGYVGYATDYPILDLLGLVDPVISKLPGGYTRKIGPGFTDRLFEVKPDYVLIISSNINCEQPSVPGSQVIFRDKRFKREYTLGGKVPLDDGFAWCLYTRKAN